MARKGKLPKGVTRGKNGRFVSKKRSTAAKKAAKTRKKRGKRK